MYGLPDLNTEDKNVTGLWFVPPLCCSSAVVNPCQVQKQLRAYLMQLMETGVTMLRIGLTWHTKTLFGRRHGRGIVGVDAAMNIYPESLAQACI